MMIMMFMNEDDVIETSRHKKKEQKKNLKRKNYCLHTHDEFVFIEAFYLINLATIVPRI